MIPKRPGDGLQHGLARLKLERCRGIDKAAIEEHQAGLARRGPVIGERHGNGAAGERRSVEPG